MDTSPDSLEEEIDVTEADLGIQAQSHSFVSRFFKYIVISTVVIGLFALSQWISINSIPILIELKEQIPVVVIPPTAIPTRVPTIVIPTLTPVLIYPTQIPATFTFEPVPTQCMLVVQVQSSPKDANIRSFPDFGDNVIRTAKNGTLLLYLGYSPDRMWVQIGINEWIHAELVSMPFCSQ